jgi:hypothetical protein
MPARYRADLADVAWGKEPAYGQMPKAVQTDSLITAGGTSVAAHLRGTWGLVTGGVDLPTPTFDWQPFYGLGVMNRNMLFPVQGRERLEGRIGQALLCHESSRLWLEQCIGLIFNAKNAEETTPDATDEYTVSSGTAAVAATTFTVTSDNFSSWNTTGSATPTHIVIVNDVTNTDPDRTQDTWAYIGNEFGSAAGFYVWKNEGLTEAGWNGIRPPGGANTKFSIHGIGLASSATVHGSSGANSNQTKYVTRDANTAKHIYVRPTLVQPSFTLAARFRADDGSNFITNYTGCKVSRVVFNFEEGNPVNFGSDFIARDMSHNIGEHDATGGAAETMKYKAEGNTANSALDATTTLPPNYMKNIRVTEQPYFYSTVSLTFHGEAIARFRRFTLTIDNGLDPRYYITQNDAGSPRDNRQILTEILEGRRNISFGGSLDLDDDGSDSYPLANGPQDASFLRMLLNQGFAAPSSGDVRDQNNMKGIGIVIELRQISSQTSGIEYDKIKFHIGPTSRVGAQADLGNVDDVGMIIRSAPHNIPAPPSIHVPVDIDGMASSMWIEIMDGVAAAD